MSKRSKLFNLLWHKNVLGMNYRNHDIVKVYNDPAKIRLVNNKELFKKVLIEHNIPTPMIMLSLKSRLELNRFKKLKPPFVIKPAFGAGGRGIEVIEKKFGSTFINIKGEEMTDHMINSFIKDILDGKFSMGSLDDDFAIIEEKIDISPKIKQLGQYGLPDLRLVVFEEQVISAMLRLPNKTSWGTANLSRGAWGIHIDLNNGRLISAYSKFEHERHQIYEDFYLPNWVDSVQMGLEAARLTELGLVGVDIIYSDRGPMIMECNARPGLEIQNVIRQGLKQELIDHRPAYGKSYKEIKNSDKPLRLEDWL